MVKDKTEPKWCDRFTVPFPPKEKHSSNRIFWLMALYCIINYSVCCQPETLKLIEFKTALSCICLYEQFTGFVHIEPATKVYKKNAMV